MGTILIRHHLLSIIQLKRTLAYVKEHLEMPKLEIKTLTHRFDHYPPCIVPIAGNNIEQPTAFTYEELTALRKSWLKCISPLFRHMENPEDVGTLLSAFYGSPESLPVRPGLLANDYLWQLIRQIARLFPALIFTQIERTVAETQGRDSRRYKRSKWIRNTLEKDLKKCEGRLRRMRDKVRGWINTCETNEHDQGFLVLEHILGCVLQEVHGKSLRTLIRILASE